MHWFMGPYFRPGQIGIQDQLPVLQLRRHAGHNQSAGADNYLVTYLHICSHSASTGIEWKRLPKHFIGNRCLVLVADPLAPFFIQ